MKLLEVAKLSFTCFILQHFMPQYIYSHNDYIFCILLCPCGLTAAHASRGAGGAVEGELARGEKGGEGGACRIKGHQVAMK